MKYISSRSYPRSSGSITLILLSLFLVVFGVLRIDAVIALDSASIDWDPILYIGNSDPADDQQTSNGGGEADIVGDALNAALFKQYLSLIHI